MYVGRVKIVYRLCIERIWSVHKVCKASAPLPRVERWDGPEGCLGLGEGGGYHGGEGGGVGGRGTGAYIYIYINFCSVLISFVMFCSIIGYIQNYTLAALEGTHTSRTWFRRSSSCPMIVGAAANLGPHDSYILFTTLQPSCEWSHPEARRTNNLPWLTTTKSDWKTNPFDLYTSRMFLI